MIDFPAAMARLGHALERFDHLAGTLAESTRQYASVRLVGDGEVAEHVRLLIAASRDAYSLALACADLAMAQALFAHVELAGADLLSVLLEETSAAFTIGFAERAPLLFAYAFTGRTNDLATYLHSVQLPDDICALLPRSREAASRYLTNTPEMVAATHAWSAIPQREDPEEAP